MAFIDRSTRVGRSQGASIFWGLVSACFASAACFYFFQNQKNEASANQLRDTVRQMQDQNESLISQRDHLQISASETATQLKTREDLIANKEAQLAAEETRIEALGQQSQSKTAANVAQVAMVRKFNDVITKLGKDTPPDVVERGGRPVLRVPNAQLFAAGDSALTADGKTLLGQVAQALGGQIDTFELRVVCYTDTNAELPETNGTKLDPGEPAAHAPCWFLTSARAAAIARYFRDQTQLPFLNVLVLGRGDSEPIASNTGANHTRNQRTEITITPLPVSFHAPEVEKVTPAPAKAPKDTPKPAAANPAPTPAPAKKDADKEKEKPAGDKPKAVAPTPPSSSSRGH